MPRARHSAAGDRVIAAHREAIIFLAGCWWPGSLPGVVRSASFCVGANEWYYVIHIEGIETDCVFPESNLKNISLLDRMAEAAGS